MKQRIAQIGMLIAGFWITQFGNSVSTLRPSGSTFILLALV